MKSRRPIIRAKSSDKFFNCLTPIGILYIGLLAAFCATGAGRAVSTLSKQHTKSELTISSSFPEPKDKKWFPGAFPILSWDRPQNPHDLVLSCQYGLHSIAECNFNIAGFVKPEDLPVCEKLGLAVLVVTGPRRWWSTVPDREIDRRIKEVVMKSGNSKAVIGYYIDDEPKASEFPALAKAVRAVRKYAPGKIAYVNLFPVYAKAGIDEKSQLGTSNYREYLERFVNEVKPQVISYDNYMVQLSQDLKNRGAAANYYENLIQVRGIALEHDLPFWNVVSSNRIRPHTPIPSPANLLFQAYTTLAAGGRGIAWYTYYDRDYGYAPVDRSNSRTLTWRYLQEVNRQISTLGPTMNQLNSIGVYFTSPAPAKSLPVLPGELVYEIKADTPMMVGEFKHNDGTGHVMVVNLSLEKSGRFTLKNVKAHRKMEIVSPENGALQQVVSESEFLLVAGQGMLIRLEVIPKP